MSRLGWRLLSVLARALEPAERDAVLGDLAESGGSIGAAMRDLLGLIIRRQVGLWVSWRPWLALCGVCGLAGLPLSQIVMGLSNDSYKYAAHYDTNLTAGQEVAYLLCLAGALLVWSWTCGVVLGTLSARAAWLTWSVFYFVVVNSALARSVLEGRAMALDQHGQPVPLLQLLMVAALPLSIHTLPFLFASLFGTFVGVRRRVLVVTHAYLIGSVNIALAFFTTWTTGWYAPAHLPPRWPRVPWPTRLLPFLLVSVPAACLLTSAYLRRNDDRGRGDAALTTPTGS